MIINRNMLAVYAKGKGMEIGAYHNPFPVTPFAEVTYVDKNSYNRLIEMRNADSNLGPTKPIARVDIIDDGQWLKKISDNSQDFVLSSHQLEHCESPLTAIKNHIRVLKKDGVVVYAVPDKRFTFDKGRTITEFKHIFNDFLNDTDPVFSKTETINHYHEYLEVVDKIYDPTVRQQIALDRMSNGGDVHFHCWDSESLLDVFTEFREIVLTYEIELFSRAGHENFVVLRKV